MSDRGGSWLDPFGVPIEKDGVILPARRKIKLGDGISAVDNEANDSTDLDAAGGGSDELTPVELGLGLDISNQAIVNFMPDALVYVNDDMSVTSLTRFTALTESTPQTPTIAGGQFTISHPSGGAKNSGFQEGADIGMCQAATSIQVVSRTGAVDTNTYENLGVGIAKDSNNFILALWRRREGAHGTASIQVKISGSSNFRGDVALSVAWTPPFELGFSLVANSLTFWQRPAGGAWTKITSYAVAATFNFKTSSLTGWKPVFWLATESSQSVAFVLDNFKVGRFGSVGFRDPYVVVNEDGSPRITGSQVHLAATLTDPQASAYCGIFTLDLLTQTLTQTGILMVSRSGACQNDNAAQIIAYDDGTFRLFITTWGDAGGSASAIQILYKRETSLDLLSGANVVSSMAQLTLPFIGSDGCYDPSVVKIGSLWYIAYTVGPAAPSTFYPALASSPDLVTWTGVGSDSASFPYEGTRIMSLGGQYWVMSASISKTNVYDLAMRKWGIMASFVQGSGSPPHPTLVPYGQFIYQVTFDNTLYLSVANTLGHYRCFRARRYGGRGAG